MKHALITLIIVLLFVLIVVPLIYIAIGKLKNPIDFFAIHKVGDAGLITKKSNFISPNYIPESGTASKTKLASDSYKNLLEDVDNCFSEDSLRTISEEFFSLEKKEESRLNIKNDVTGTTRYFEGFYPTVETEKSVTKKRNRFYTLSFIIRPDCAKNGTKIDNLLAGFNDSGLLMNRMMKGGIDGFDFTNKGITTINGLAYYWYMFEDQNRLYVEPGDEVFYSTFYSTQHNGVFHISSYEGSSLVFGTPRDFLNQTQVFLSGTVYGTSTPWLVQPAATSTPDRR